MSKVLVDEETKKRVIEKRKAGVSMRIISKEDHLSFTTISKIWNEKEGQKDPIAEKSVTSRAFFLFEQNRSLVDVTLELDLIQQKQKKFMSYLRLKGLDKIARYIQSVENHISSFLDFVITCEEYTPESQKLVEVFNLQKVIKGLEYERLGKVMAIESLQRKINKLKQDEETTKKNIQDLKQEEYNRWHIYYLETGNTIRISNILSNKRGIRG
ncbi:MAG: hypothetical protein AB7U98_06280 [Candidatus Nitrosocosmicus sp.]|jgi:hypothetical protein|nr:hypothetical protein [Candidatus Nitrosocosmicus sp.]